MLDARHQRRTGGRRRQHVERGPDRRVADRVDLASRCRRRPPRATRGSPSAVGHPDAAAALRAASGRSGSGSMSSSRAAVRDPSEPSAKHFCQPDPGAAVRIVAEDGATADARARWRSPARRPRTHAWTRTGSRPVVREVRVGRVRVGRGRGRGRRRPGRGRRRRPSETSSRPTVSMAAARSAWLGRGHVDRDEAGRASRTGRPRATPSGPRRMTPPEDPGRRPETPPVRSAAWLARSA